MNAETGRTGMAQSLLREVAGALNALAAERTETAIDLRSLPMTAADRDELETTLGQGEVSVTLTAAGRSEIWETRFAGVWWVRHFGGDGRVATEAIEVTLLPAMLAAHPDDVTAAGQRLATELEEARHV
jgi:hydrogenase-1 operon protein HyaF